MLRRFLTAGLIGATLIGGIAPAYAQRGEDRGGMQRPAQTRPNMAPGGEGRAGRGPQGWRQQGGAGVTPAPQAPRARGGNEAGWQGSAGRQRDWNASNRAQGAIAGEQRNWQRGSSRPERGNDMRQPPAPVMNRPNEPDMRQDWRNDRRDDRQDWRQDRRDDRQDWRQDQRGDRRDWRQDQRGDRQDWRQDRRDDRRDWRDDRRDGNWNSGRRFDDRSRWTTQRRWDNGWRNDRRYDWRGYRARYGDRYRIGRYYAPSGWSYGYRRFSVGIFLSGLLYSNSYWLDDPWAYRLPPAYGTLRWIRYYDDALLVDIRDGYVVDVIHDFFW